MLGSTGTKIVRCIKATILNHGCYPARTITEHIVPVIIIPGIVPPSICHWAASRPATYQPNNNYYDHAFILIVLIFFNTIIANVIVIIIVYLFIMINSSSSYVRILLSSLPLKGQCHEMDIFWGSKFLISTYFLDMLWWFPRYFNSFSMKLIASFENAYWKPLQNSLHFDWSKFSSTEPSLAAVVTCGFLYMLLQGQNRRCRVSEEDY